jgi:hypothetical protein
MTINYLRNKALKPRDFHISIVYTDFNFRVGEILSANSGVQIRAGDKTRSLGLYSGDAADQLLSQNLE